MKKILFITMVLMTSGLFMAVNSQICTPPAPTGTPGLSPTWDSLPCIVRGQAYNAVLELENFTSVGGISINSLRLDSIGVNPDAMTGAYYYSGLPSGITVATNKGNPPVTYNPGETGCVVISGTTNDPIGNYRLGIWVTINVPFLGNVSGEAGALVQQLAPTSGFNFVYYLRVVDSFSQCPPDSALVFIGIPTSVNSTDKLNTGMEIFPNPSNGKFIVRVNQETDRPAEIYIMDMMGKVVRQMEIGGQGMPETTFDLHELQSGIYQVRLITNGKTATQKILLFH